MEIASIVGITASSVWWYRRQAREALPRKRRMEALLKELDNQE